MNRVLRVTVDDLDATVQAGVTHRQLNKHLANTGLTFFVDPGADATLGGMTATGASGTTAVRYGTMRENVRGLTVVLADGRVITTGGRARKSSAGYDLTRIFVGSEGTLGVISEVTVRLHPLPEAVAAAVCSYPTIDAAVRTVIATIQLGVPVARIELLDEVQMDAINRFSKLDYPVQPTLFFEFHGHTEREVGDQAETVQAISAEHDGSGFVWVTRPEDRARLWRARHDSYYASLALRPGAKAWTTDACVPISRLADCIVASKRDLDESPLTGTLVGHVGDGNFHMLYLVDPDRPEELDEARRLNERLVYRAIEMSGTCSGEHGVGVGKMRYLPREHGEGLDAMRAIKRALDPRGLMNPGKILPS
jgi:D-lactate dehydrogenase (cytochrome)